MPTTKKRINLAVSDEIYERIVEFKKKHGIDTDAAACVQLIIQQLNSLDETESMMKVISNFSIDQLTELSKIGLQKIKESGQL